MTLSEAVIRKRANNLELQDSRKVILSPAFVAALEALLHDVYAILRPGPIDYDLRYDLVKVFDTLAKEKIHGVGDGVPSVDALGSFTMDMFTSKSDLDLSVNFDRQYGDVSRDMKISVLRKFSRVMYSLQRFRGKIPGTTQIYIESIIYLVGKSFSDLSVIDSSHTKISQSYFVHHENSFMLVLAPAPDGFPVEIGSPDRGQVFGVTPILKARVPVLKVVDCVTGIECDISVENKDGIMRSGILRIISSIDERFRILCFLMKAWAKAHDINSSKDRTLNSLSIILLVAFHLQTRSPPILPPFSALLKDGTDITRLANVVHGFQHFGSRNKESLAELFITLLIKVEDFTDRSQNVARSVGIAEVKKIYNCIRSSVSHISAFMKGQNNQAVDLNVVLFGPDVVLSLRNQHIHNAQASLKRSIPLHDAPPSLNHPIPTKRMRYSDEAVPLQAPPFPPPLHPPIAPPQPNYAPPYPPLNYAPPFAFDGFGPRGPGPFYPLGR